MTFVKQMLFFVLQFLNFILIIFIGLDIILSEQALKLLSILVAFVGFSQIS